MNNVRVFSEIVSLSAFVSAVSQGVGSVSTGWVSMADYGALCAVIKTGVLGAAATVDVKLEQATDGAGTGVKDITGKAITQIVKATGDNKQAMINVREADMDIANAFTHVRATLTVAAAASLVDVTLFGIDRRYGKGTAGNPASVVQVV